MEVEKITCFVCGREKKYGVGAGIERHYRVKHEGLECPEPKDTWCPACRKYVYGGGRHTETLTHQEAVAEAGTFFAGLVRW